MRAALALALLVTPAAAAPAPPPHGPGCALSTAECTVVAREMAADDIEALDDEQAFGYPADLKLRLALIDRHYARLKARVSRLPPRVANEIARLKECQAADILATKQGTENLNPQCR